MLEKKSKKTTVVWCSGQLEQHGCINGRRRAGPEMLLEEEEEEEEGAREGRRRGQEICGCCRNRWGNSRW